ncbi:CCN family member 2 isoform X1 [Pogona vitticeps]
MLCLSPRLQHQAHRNFKEKEKGDFSWNSLHFLLHSLELLSSLSLMCKAQPFWKRLFKDELECGTTPKGRKKRDAQNKMIRMLDNFGAFINITLFLFALEPGWVAAQTCSYPCQCPSQTPQCPAGISLLLDGCGCCKVCARQLDEPCSLQKPCDRHKGLYCDSSENHRDHGICLAHEGATCDLLGRIYSNGESFQPNCKLQCTCMDGAIGCIPLCADGPRLPSSDCPFPRRVKAQNKCCEEWVCEGSSQKKRYVKGMSVYRNNPSHKPKPKPKINLKTNSLQDNCLVQTTEWSACSKTCGIGISTRVTNNNSRCRLEKESQLCLVRYCNALPENSFKKGRKCAKTRKTRRAIRFEFTGCTSTRSYRPKFCGSCTDGRCCTPRITSTTNIEFQCPEGDSFVWKMMVIKSCSCHYDCPADNDIFLAVYRRRMIGDHVKLGKQ